MTASLSLVACATTGAVAPVIGAGVAATVADVWTVDVSGTDPEHAEQIRNCVLGRLIDGSLASRVVPPGMPADRVLAIDVTRLRAVPLGERILLGTLAGRNVVAATETLRDPHAPSGPPIKVFRVEAESAANPVSGVARFEDALGRFGDETLAGLHG